MNFSELQKYILKRTYLGGSKTPRGFFNSFYRQAGEIEVKTITKSLERLIAKGLIVGFGHKTAEKWFTEKVALTQRGRKITRRLFGQQQALPFVRRRRRAKR